MKRIETPNHARFLTFSCYRREALFTNDSIKHAFVENLDQTREAHSLLLYAWVVMPEHVHLILRSSHPVSEVMQTLKTGFAHRVIGRWRELDASVLTRITDSRGQPRFWQRGGGYDRNLVMGSELMDKIRYVHENPVRRGLVERPQDWAWSSARWWMGMRDGAIRCDSLSA